MSEQPYSPVPPMEPAAPEITSDDRLWALLCFLLTPLFPLITILMEDKKNRPFLKYHGVPTLILGIVEGIVMGILGIIPIIQCFVPLIYIINIIWAIKANKGEYVEIPIITSFAKNQGWI